MAAPILPPPLREGDRLTREEFLRRWEAMPELKHAELIDGMVHMASPVFDLHADFHLTMGAWLRYYAGATPGCKAVSESTWLMAANSVPQPDLSLRIRADYGGQSGMEGGYTTGAPELIVEISDSSIRRDSGSKLRLYERSGVLEYLIVQPAKKVVEWRELDHGKYRPLEADPDGVFRSRVFPGLWLHPATLWEDDFAALYATLQQGLATQAHGDFVSKLAAAKR